MDRYHIYDALPVASLKMKFTDIKDESKEKSFTVTVGDLVSILYIHNVHEVGRRKEFVIHCKVLAVLYEKDNRICTNCNNPDTIYGLLVDAGKDYNSKRIKLNLHNILDIHRYKFDYDLNEDIQVVPDISMDGFFVNEITYPQKFDVSTDNDPLLGDYDFNGEVYNNE